MPLPALVAALAPVAMEGLNAYLGRDAAQTAANQAAQSQREAFAYSKAMYDKAEANLSPWMKTGEAANARLAGLVSGLTAPQFDYQQEEFDYDKNKDPAVQVALDRAAQAINSSALAKGGMGGGTVKALNTEMQNQSAQGYGQAWNRYLDKSKMMYGQAADKYGRAREWQNNLLGANRDLSESGRNSAGALAGFGTGQGQFGAGIMQGIGQTQAGGTMLENRATMNGLAGALNQAAPIFGNSDWFDQPKVAKR